MRVLGQGNVTEWGVGRDWLFLALLPICSLNGPIFLIIPTLYLALFGVRVRFLLLPIPLSLLLLFLSHINCPSPIHYLGKYLDLNSLVTGHVSSTHGPDTARLINTLLFNGARDGKLMDDARSLGIAHLLTVSGFHLSLLRRILPRRLSLPILLLYWAALGYTLPALRVILNSSMGVRNRWVRWSLAVLLTCPLQPNAYATMPFLMSYVPHLLFLITGHGLGKSPLGTLSGSLATFIYISLLLLPRVGGIFPLAPLNTILFAPIISILFMYFLLLWPVPMAPAHGFISGVAGDIFGLFRPNAWLLPLRISPALCSASLILFMASMLLLHRLRTHDKFPLFRRSGDT